MSPAAAAHVRAHFGFERQLRETIDLYRRLAGIPETAPPARRSLANSEARRA
jgi:hypothetical protein